MRRKKPVDIRKMCYTFLGFGVILWLEKTAPTPAGSSLVLIMKDLASFDADIDKLSKSWIHPGRVLNAIEEERKENQKISEV